MTMGMAIAINECLHVHIIWWSKERCPKFIVCRAQPSQKSQRIKSKMVKSIFGLGLILKAVTKISWATSYIIGSKASTHFTLK